MPAVRSAPKPGFNHLRSNLYCCDDGSARKYWALYARDKKQNGPAVTVWGRLGGKMRISDYNGGERIDIPKLIQSKVAKGYKPFPSVAAWDRPASLKVSPDTKTWLKKQKPAAQNATRLSKSQPKTSRTCARDQILNPESNRCVSRSGPTGKRLLSKSPKSSKSSKSATKTGGDNRKSQKTSKSPKGSKSCARDQIRNPVSGRCVSRSGPTGKRLLHKRASKPSKPSKPSSKIRDAAALTSAFTATEKLLRRAGKERAKKLKPPKSMLLTMAQVKRIRNNQLTLPVVPPWPRQKPKILDAFEYEIAEDYFWEHQQLAVVDDALVWWVISPQLVSWLEKQL